MARKSKPTYYSDEDHEILRNLFSQYGDPNKSRRFKYWEEVCEDFNSLTTSAKRNPIQIRAYFRLRKQRCSEYPLKMEAQSDYLNGTSSIVDPAECKIIYLINTCIIGRIKYQWNIVRPKVYMLGNVLL